MDENTDLSEVRRGDANVHDLRDVDARIKAMGLNRLTPIDPQTYPRMEWLWNNIKTQDYAFDDFSRGQVEAFALSLLDTSSLHFEVGTHGYAVVRNLRTSDNPFIHYCVWDKAYPFREILKDGNELLAFLFDRLNVARVTAWVPIYNTQARKFSTLMGFKFEGELRNAILHHEKHYNVQMYGMLREEWQRRTLSRA